MGINFKRATVSIVGLIVIVAGTVVTTTASHAGEDPVDLSCKPSIDGPTAPTNGHIVSATGAYSCLTVRPSIGVTVCLEYNGVIVDCNQDVRLDSSRAEASVSFPCLPGVWTATVAGVAAGGPPGAGLNAVIQLECDPMGP